MVSLFRWKWLYRRRNCLHLTPGTVTVIVTVCEFTAIVSSNNPLKDPIFVVANIAFSKGICSLLWMQDAGCSNVTTLGLTDRWSGRLWPAVFVGTRTVGNCSWIEHYSSVTSKVNSRRLHGYCFLKLRHKMSSDGHSQNSIDSTTLFTISSKVDQYSVTLTVL